MKWIPVTESLPKCSRNPDAFGVPVLIWPRCPDKDRESSGLAFYGRRATGGRPTFYLFGGEIRGVTHWQPLPDGPSKKDEAA